MKSSLLILFNMDKTKMSLNNIKLLQSDAKTVLFFHADTLQIYPIDCDSELCKFLKSIESAGFETTKKIYGDEDFNTLYDFVIKTIESAPRSTIVELNRSGKEKFKSVILPISGGCNLNCPYCFAQTDGGFHFGDFTKKDADDVIGFLARNNENHEDPINIVFFGGEPLLKFDMMKYIVQCFKQKYPNQKVNYSITTNGTILNEEILNFFKDNDVAVLLSLDGPDNEFNLRKFRDGRKSIDVVLKNIDLLKQHEIPMELRATMISTNPYIVETFDFFENIGRTFNIVFAYQSANKSHEECSSYSEKSLLAIQKQLEELFVYYKKRIDIGKPIFTKILKNTADVLSCRIKHETACSAGKYYFTITSSGDIYSCAHLMNDVKYKMGDIYNGIEYGDQFVPVNVSDIEDCKNCWVKYLCSGGCVSQKISTGRSAQTSKVQNSCALEKIEWAFYLKLYYYAKQKNNISENM